MKIAVAQMKCALGDVPANCRTLASLIERARGGGCEAIVFPEICDTGYEMSVIREHASTWPGLPFDTIQSAAARHGIHVICGLSEREGRNIYNAAAVFNPKGELLAKYRKAHLFTPSPVNEDRCFTAGGSLEVVTIGDLKWGLMICYDLRFPELARALALKGAEVLALCTAWPFPRVGHLQTLVQARAIENQAYFVSANRVGTDGPVTFCGSSCVVDPYGVTVVSAAADREELIVGEINRETLAWVRDRMPIFPGRRTDLYGDLNNGPGTGRKDAESKPQSYCNPRGSHPRRAARARVLGPASEPSFQAKSASGTTPGSQLKLRLMTRDDLPVADQLRALAGWNQTLDDWQRLRACEPTGCFVAEWKGEPVGTATTTTYGHDLAWIGMVLVHPEQRRRGIGKALLLHCIDYLKQRGITCIKLDATPLGKTLYDGLGFKDEWTLQRWEASAVQLPATQMKYHVRPWCVEDHAVIQKLDREAFGADRWRMLFRLSWEVCPPLVHESPAGRVNGWGLVRNGMNAVYLGPVVAEAVPVAGAMIKALLAALPENRVYWDIPDHQPEMVELAKRLGFVPQRLLIRMYLGENKTPGKPELVHAIAAPEIG